MSVPAQRTTCLLVATLAALLPVACGGKPVQALSTEQPNLVLVVIDTLRRDHVGSYGYSKPTTPFMDGLAIDGVVFERAFSQASQTFASTSSLFTSRHFPITGGRRGDGDHKLHSVADVNLTLAEVLNQDGYDTLALFTNPHHYPASGFWQGFDEAEFTTAKEALRDSPLPYRTAPDVVDGFRSWLAERGRGTGNPFFAYLHFMDVHNPYRAPKDLATTFEARGGRRGLYMNGKPTGDEVPTQTDLRGMQGRYDAEIRLVDRELERMVEELVARGLWENTVLVVTSDHGDEFMEHGGLGHGRTLEKEMIAIPLLVHFGSTEGPRGVRVPGVVRNLDLAPTLLDIAGVEIPTRFEGRSLHGLFTEASLGETTEASYARIGNQRSLSTRDWHFIRDQHTGDQKLYDLGSDPAGLIDVAHLHADVVDAFNTRIADFETERIKAIEASQAIQEAEATSPAALDPELLDQLEALGYL